MNCLTTRCTPVNFDIESPVAKLLGATTTTTTSSPVVAEATLSFLTTPVVEVLTPLVVTNRPPTPHPSILGIEPFTETPLHHLCCKWNRTGQSPLPVLSPLCPLFLKWNPFGRKSQLMWKDLVLPGCKMSPMVSTRDPDGIPSVTTIARLGSPTISDEERITRINELFGTNLPLHPKTDDDNSSERFSVVTDEDHVVTTTYNGYNLFDNNNRSNYSPCLPIFTMLILNDDEAHSSNNKTVRPKPVVVNKIQPLQTIHEYTLTNFDTNTSGEMNSTIKRLIEYAKSISEKESTTVNLIEFDAESNNLSDETNDSTKKDRRYYPIWQWNLVQLRFRSLVFYDIAFLEMGFNPDECSSANKSTLKNILSIVRTLTSV
ncbi:hypothetical protein PS6_011424 [Mucor atramentarius]